MARPTKRRICLCYMDRTEVKDVGFIKGVEIKFLSATRDKTRVLSIRFDKIPAEKKNRKMKEASNTEKLETVKTIFD